MRIPGIMIAAPASGSGKTAAACALLSAFRQNGIKVRSCKCGPDYIDPMFHREILDIESENLDLFFEGKENLRNRYALNGKNADLVITEGVMGYYDGMTMDSEKGSSCEIAQTLGLPVILVVSGKGAALSLAAQIRGMAEFRAEQRIRGILLNRISSGSYPRLKEMLERELKNAGHHIRVLGYLPENEAFVMESRHLGLVTPQETEGIRDRLIQAGQILKQTADLDAIMEIAETAENIEISAIGAEQEKEPKVRIGIAEDKAFCFYYKDNLELLEESGCILVPFSPISDTCLPEGISGILFGGGYPELYADRLSGNENMLRAVKKAAEEGMPIIAECGGFMYLHRELTDKEGKQHKMAGVIDGKTYPTKTLTQFGYITVTTDKTSSGLLQPKENIRGHEFHYWKSTAEGKDCTAEKPDKKRQWNCIWQTDTIFAGYPHLYYPSNPKFVLRFVEKCRNYQIRMSKGVRHL